MFYYVDIGSNTPHFSKSNPGILISNPVQTRRYTFTGLLEKSMKFKEKIIFQSYFPKIMQEISRFTEYVRNNAYALK
jgi:hypothetical protein